MTWQIECWMKEWLNAENWKQNSLIEANRERDGWAEHCQSCSQHSLSALLKHTPTRLPNSVSLSTLSISLYHSIILSLLQFVVLSVSTSLLNRSIYLERFFYGSKPRCQVWDGDAVIRDAVGRGRGEAMQKVAWPRSEKGRCEKSRRTGGEQQKNTMKYGFVRE